MAEGVLSVWQKLMSSSLHRFRTHMYYCETNPKGVMRERQLGFHFAAEELSTEPSIAIMLCLQRWPAQHS